METRKRLCYAAALLALLTLASCGQDDADGTLLPAGKYPMTFTTSVKGLAATRATTDNAWDGSEQVALQVDGEVKEYSISGSGASATLTSSDPFYWTSAEETKTVEGWYCGDGGYAAALESWQVASDQSAADPSAYQASDFLYAPAQDISYKSENKSLAFYHQTARVVINIVKTKEVADAGRIVRVAFGDSDNLALSGKYTAPEGGATVGTWDTQAGASMGTVTPKEIAAPGGDGYLKSYTALLIPQNMQGKKFIAITLDDGNTYYYIPENADDANFEAGKEYTYDVTLQSKYLDAVLVSVDGEWGGGSTIKVTGILAGYAPHELKPGDYYYSDGSTSDGGYRKYSDGSTELLSDVEPITGRTVIGIVYSTDVSRIGQAATKKLEEKGITPHGLVLAAKDCTYSTIPTAWDWDSYPDDLDGGVGQPFHENTDTAKKMYNNVDGYGETNWIIENGNNSLAAFFEASEFGKTSDIQYAAPEQTTGWFIPSSGQWWDILSNLGERDELAWHQDDNYGYGGIAISEYDYNARDKISRHFTKIYQYKRELSMSYWSSTECDANKAHCVEFGDYPNSPELYMGPFNKRGQHHVRCILAF